MSDSMKGIPGASAMNDTLEFVRNFWGTMKIPGMAMPSMSPDDINKQIADLKAVEGWLQMNMNMLRSTIQALEVQSATLSALQSMSESFAKAGKGEFSGDAAPAFESPFAKAAANPAPGAMPDASAFAAQFANPATWWNNMQEQFSTAVSSAMQAPEPKKTARKSSPSTAKKRSASPARKTSKR